MKTKCSIILVCLALLVAPNLRADDPPQPQFPNLAPTKKPAGNHDAERLNDASPSAQQNANERYESQAKLRNQVRDKEPVEEGPRFISEEELRKRGDVNLGLEDKAFQDDTTR